MKRRFERTRQWLCSLRGHRVLRVIHDVQWEDTGYGRVIGSSMSCGHCGKELPS